MFVELTDSPKITAFACAMTSSTWRERHFTSLGTAPAVPRTHTTFVPPCVTFQRPGPGCSPVTTTSSMGADSDAVSVLASFDCANTGVERRPGIRRNADVRSAASLLCMFFFIPAAWVPVLARLEPEPGRLVPGRGAG